MHVASSKLGQRPIKECNMTVVRVGDPVGEQFKPWAGAGCGGSLMECQLSLFFPLCEVNSPDVAPETAEGRKACAVCTEVVVFYSQISWVGSGSCYSLLE